MQINRLFEIIYILLNRKNITAKELARHFEVSSRTIYRDIDTLCQAGIPIYTNKGKGGGICLLENFVLNKSILTKQEQKDILSALQGINATSYVETDAVLSKLSSLFGNNEPDWIEVDFSNWANMEEEKCKFNQLKESILNRNLISFDYYNSYGSYSHRIVEPVKLIFRAQAWYLHGYCREKEDLRYFKFSRMKNLVVSEEIFTPRPLIKPEKERDYSHNTQKTSIVLKVDAELAFRICDEFPNESVQKNEDGSFLIHADMYLDGWLYSYLMSFEDHLEVLEPKSVREEMIKKLKNTLNKYDN
ncbi:YafY family transcriptional regulator [Mobilitalea sibirica]|uniref:YafY family transcriptional regulator n=1 Tax=Mobilitalea sibirica TaxID=1462919 RepID=A0A8J7H697_9FIRM|nr:YafY family protein [Mobilitalea sibirica]MBH1942284.1 YafY family transcriptional regulator [Mobilitalea sibirica]